MIHGVAPQDSPRPQGVPESVNLSACYLYPKMSSRPTNCSTAIGRFLFIKRSCALYSWLIKQCYITHWSVRYITEHTLYTSYSGGRTANPYRITARLLSEVPDRLYETKFASTWWANIFYDGSGYSSPLFNWDASAHATPTNSATIR